jgi:hypothetical protein
MVQGFHKRKTLKYFPISGHVLNLSCSGGHLEFLIYNNLEYIVWGHPMIIHVHFGFNQISSVWKKKYFHFSLTVICKYIRPLMVAILNFQPPPPKKKKTFGRLLSWSIQQSFQYGSKPYNKRDDFNLPIVNFPFKCSTCICSIYLSVDPIFQSLWFLSGLLWQRVDANKKDTNPRVPIGYIEVITSKVLRLPTWLG